MNERNNINHVQCVTDIFYLMAVHIQKERDCIFDAWYFKSAYHECFKWPQNMILSRYSRFRDTKNYIFKIFNSLTL